MSAADDQALESPLDAGEHRKVPHGEFGSSTVWDTVSIQWKHCTYKTDPKTLNGFGSDWFQAILDTHQDNPYEPFPISLTDDLFLNEHEFDSFFDWIINKTKDACFVTDVAGHETRLIGVPTSINEKMSPTQVLERFTHLANYFNLPQFKLLLNELVRRGAEIYPPDALIYADRYHCQPLLETAARYILIDDPKNFKRAIGEKHEVTSLVEAISHTELLRCAMIWKKAEATRQIIYNLAPPSPIPPSQNFRPMFI